MPGEIFVRCLLAVCRRFAQHWVRRYCVVCLFFGVLQLQGHLAVVEKVVCCLLPSLIWHLEARPVSEGSVVSVPWLKSSVYLKLGEN